MEFGVTMFPTDYSMGPAELAIAVEEREFDAESSLAEAPRSTVFQLDQESIRKAMEESIAATEKNESGFRAFLSRLVGKKKE